MKTVTLRSATEYRNGIVKAGQTLEVSEAQAEEWAKRGLLHEGRGATEQEILRDGVRRTDDGIAARHGDVEAALRLARMDRGGDAEPAEPRLVFFPGTAAQFEALSDAGYGTPDAIRAASDEELLAVKGISDKGLRALRDAYGQD